MVFHRDGFQSARMDDIADALGITKGGLYYYVRTKHELLFDIILPPYRDAVAHLDGVLASSSSTPERIGEVVTRYLGNVARYSPAISIYVENLRSLPVPPEMSELDARYVRGLRRLIADGVRDGSLRACDPAIAADALLGMCARFAVRYSSLAPFDPDAVARDLTAIFLGGLASKPGSRGDEMSPRRA
jgi:AcrR family transcriptional regulator